MNKTNKQFDLEERTYQFARRVEFLKKIPKTISNIEDAKQEARASGSIGANYIEANESLSKKDFKMRIKICKKEAKEARYWLKLIDFGNNKELEKEQKELIKEATELMNIFGGILTKCKQFGILGNWKIEICFGFRNSIFEIKPHQ